jgi:hypothetical protein
MREAKIQTFRNDEAEKRVVVLIEFSDEGLSDYEFDHLGDIVFSYLSILDFGYIAGPKSVRTTMTDEQLDQEEDDFTVTCASCHDARDRDAS